MEQSELPHFHYNEALLKPFENLLSMDTCDPDVQVSTERGLSPCTVFHRFSELLIVNSETSYVIDSS